MLKNELLGSGNMKKVLKISKIIFFGLLLSFLVSVDFTKAAITASEAESSFFLQLGYRFHSFGFVHILAAAGLSAIIWFTDRLKEKNIVRKNVWIYIACALFGILNALSQHLYYTDHFPATFVTCFIALLYATACAVISYFMAALIFSNVKSIYRIPELDESGKKRRKWFWIAFGIILIGWLPWLITYYPASADWDVYHPISEYLGLKERNNQHPWFYCTTVGSFYNLGMRIGNKNIGIYLYILLRAVAMSAIYSWLVVRLRDHGVKKAVLIAVILFYAAVPVWGAYAKHAFKDTQGAAFFCWFIVLTVECVRDIRAGKHRILNFALYSISSLLMSLYRNNCIYVAVPTTILLAVAVLAQKTYETKKKLAICLVMVMGLGVYEGYQVYIKKFEKVAGIPLVEALSIPVQQTARTVRDHEETITEEEREAISSVMDYERLPKIYDPLLSDPVKWTFVQIPENVRQYFRVWFGMMFRFPVSYLEAAVAQSYGYYAFTPDQAERAGNRNCGMTIFNWTKDGRFSDELTFDYIPSMKAARKVLDNWAKTWHKLPVIGWTDEIPIYTWIVVFLGAVLLRKKEWLRLIPICAFLLMILSCCASPVNDCFRYFAPVAASSPALMLLYPERRQG